jgi:hypothetical protein
MDDTKKVPLTVYHDVKSDVQAALRALGLRLVHEDGTEPGKSCFGFFCGQLYEASKLWGTEAEGEEEGVDTMPFECPCGRRSRAACQAATWPDCYNGSWKEKHNLGKEQS